MGVIHPSHNSPSTCKNEVSLYVKGDKNFFSVQENCLLSV